MFAAGAADVRRSSISLMDAKQQQQRRLERARPPAQLSRATQAPAAEPSAASFAAPHAPQPMMTMKTMMMMMMNRFAVGQARRCLCSSDVRSPLQHVSRRSQKWTRAFLSRRDADESGQREAGEREQAGARSLASVVIGVMRAVVSVRRAPAPARLLERPD